MSSRRSHSGEHHTEDHTLPRIIRNLPKTKSIATSFSESPAAKNELPQGSFTDIRPDEPRKREKSSPLPSSSRSLFDRIHGSKRTFADLGSPRPPASPRKKQRIDPGLKVAPPVPFIISSGPKTDDPGAELFIRGLPNDVQASEVQDAVANAFHNPPFRAPDAPLMNFHVRLGIRPPINAWVTIPYVRIAQHFLDLKYRLYLGNDFDLPLKVVQSNHAPDPHIVRKLRITPYVSSDEVAQREGIAELLSTKTPMRDLSFGVWTNDQVFSAEYTVDGARDRTSFDGSIEMWYESDRRAIIVQRTGQPIIVPFERHPVSPRNFVIIFVRDISYVWVDSEDSSILFHLRCPATFERDSSKFLDSGPQHDGNDRDRAFSFDADHLRVAPFTSHTIRLRFISRISCSSFVSRTKHIRHFPIPEHRSFDKQRGSVYGLRFLYSLQEWYKTIPLDVAFQCEQAVHNRALTPFEMMMLKEKVQTVLVKGGAGIAAGSIHNLIQFLSGRDIVRSGPRTQRLDEIFEKAAAKAVLEDRANRRWSSPDMALCYQVYLTPTGYIIDGPYSDRSNRVLRMYPQHHHHFLRVSFTDEGGQGRRLKKPFRSMVDWPQFVDVRIGEILRRGFDLCGRHFQWLGYSQSALKDHQMLFMTPFELDNVVVDADFIRRGMGLFSDSLTKQPAKYGARIAQAFSATNGTIEISEQEVERVDDIERNGYCFTDGAGDMSAEMACDIWVAMCRRKGQRSSKTPPSAFQARFGGCKGVWMVNQFLPGKVVRFRPSQCKYESPSRTFDVSATSERPVPTFLNRPLVKLLEDLGVPIRNFLDVQGRAIKTVESAQNNFLRAARLMQKTGLGTSFRAARLMTNLTEMLDIDFHSSPRQHIDFFRSITMLSITHALRDIKYRARIPVAGPTLIGVCDTWGILEEGEIYVKVSEGQSNHAALKGKFLITRSPVVHPGDVQFAMAVGEVSSTSPLNSLLNVLVFSSKGHRPLSSMLGGGDLDGDLFNVIGEESLFPMKTVEAGSYTAVTPKVLPRKSTMDDIADFVVDYVLGDLVGPISILHLTIADQSDFGSFDERCIKLAELSSHAVDFTKSGVPVLRPTLPKPDSRVKPDFLGSPEDDTLDLYPSVKALGVMFRAVPIQKYARPSEQDRDNIDASVLFKTLEQIRLRFPQFHLNPPADSYVQKKWADRMEAFCHQAEKIAFRNSLSGQDHHKLLEEELFLGTSGSAGRLEHGDSDLLHRARTQVSEIVRTLRREILDAKVDDLDDEDDDDEMEVPKVEEPDIDISYGRRAVPKEESEDVALVSLPAKNGLMSGDDDEIQILEIRRPMGKKGEEADADDDEIEEIDPPEPHVVAIQRAYAACHYALFALSAPDSPPYGTRLFALVALELALSIAARKSRMETGAKDSVSRLRRS